jgi:hypothetical protein
MPARDHIDLLVCGFSSRFRARRPMVVLAVHIDDSADDTIYSLAGWLATADNWKQFSDDFEASGLPNTFHMKKVRRHAGKRVNLLAAMPCRYATYRVDCVMHQKNYLLAAKGKVAPQLDNPYFFLFYQVILAAVHFLDVMKIDDTIDWIFDEQGQIGTDANAWYFWIKEHSAPNIKRRLGSTPIFQDDDKVLPLKAADLFAWQIRKHLSVEQPRGITPNDILRTFMDTKYGISCNMRGEDLAAMVNHITSGTGLLWQADTHGFGPKPGSVRINY